MMESRRDYLAEDQRARDAITSEIFSNFFVEAGAGSGKTTQLVRRMVAMVEEGIDVSKICAITFTKAAAKEFYHRFQQKLAERSRTAETMGQRERCAKALQNIDLCFMGTIDSFCNMILSEHPMEAHVPSGAEVKSDDEIHAIYRREYSRIKKGEYGEELKRLAVRFSGFHIHDDADFIELLSTVMQRRHATFACPKIEEDSLDSLFREEKEKISVVLKNVLSHREWIYEKNKESLDAYENLRRNMRVISGSWNLNAAYVIRGLNSIRKIRISPEVSLDDLGRYAEEIFAPHEGKGKISWYELDEEGFFHVLDRLTDLRYGISMDFILKCVPGISDTLKAEGNLSFFDYLLYLRNMLKEDAAKEGCLIRHIYERHSYYLIDEFQDTNPLQAEIFFYLASEEPTEDWRQCVPRPGSIFIVGDPKQSIYRFRDADVTSFMAVRELFQEPVGQVVKLSRNFRSTKDLCSWFNGRFSEIMPEDTEYQCRFNEIPVTDEPKDEEIFSGIYSYPVSGGKVSDLEKDETIIPELLRRLLRNPEYRLRDEKGCLRQIEYKDIMLITRTKSNIGELVQALSEAGIPFYVEGKVLFGESPSLRALVRIFTAVANPGNTFYTYGCDEDYSRLVSASKSMTGASLAGRILEEYHLFDVYGTEYMEYVYYAIELLRSEERSGSLLTLTEQAEFLNGLIQGALDIERCISLVRSQNRVHIANLHKVKGLEAPIVILAAASSRAKQPELHTQQGNPPKCWLFRGGSIETNRFEDEAEQEKKMLEAENQRLVYVAATRAKNALIIADTRGKNGNSLGSNPWSRLLEEGTENFFLLPEGKPQVPKKKETVLASSLRKEGEKGIVFSDSTSQSPTYAIKRPSQIRLQSVMEAEESSPEEGEKQEKRYADKALAGTLVHRMMEMLISSGGRMEKERMIREISMEYDAETEPYMTMLGTVYDKVTGGGYPQNNGAPQDMFEELLAADEAYCEVPFCFKEGESIWNGIMDVIYRKDEKWHIVDYKTNDEADDLDAKYQEQLTAYRKAFEEMTGQNADALIWHIEI